MNINIKKWQVLLIIYVILTPFLLTPWIHSNDPVGYFSYLRSFSFDGDVDLENEYEHYTKIFPDIEVERSDSGRVTNRYTVGTAMMWSPFYFIGHLMTLVANRFGGGHEVDGYSYFYVLMTTFASSLYAFLGILIIFQFLKKFFSEFVAFASTLAMWFATPLLFYMWLQPSMSHAISFFLVTLFIFYWHKTTKNRTYLQWGILGVITGLMSLVRPQNAVFVIIPAIESIIYYYQFIAKKEWKQAKELLLRNLLFILVIFVVWIPQFLVLKELTGSYFSLGQTTTFDAAILLYPKNVFRVLFATHGLISWTPIVAVSIVGLFMFIKKEKKLSWLLILSFLLQLYLMSTWRGWYGGAAFGQRKFLNCILIFAIGLASVIEYLRNKRIKKWAISVILLAFIAWNFGLVIQFGSRMIPAGCCVPFKEIVWNNFTKVPKSLISIIKKFLFSRGSLITK